MAQPPARRARRGADAPAPRRVRRTAEDAREAILDAAERRLKSAGPAGIRLQEVAADVGVSHPTVLHHFGSREALVEAVCNRAARRLSGDMLAAIAAAPEDDQSIASMLDRVHEVLGTGGHARVIAWLALSGITGQPEDPGIRAIADAAHALRRTRREGKRRVPPPEDTYFTLLLAALSLFGDAVAGAAIRGEDEAEAARTSARFRAWLAKLLSEHLEHG